MAAGRISEGFNARLLQANGQCRAAENNKKIIGAVAMKTFSNKVAVITGAGSGIGRYLAMRSCSAMTSYQPPLKAL